MVHFIKTRGNVVIKQQLASASNTLFVNPVQSNTLFILRLFQHD